MKVGFCRGDWRSLAGVSFREMDVDMRTGSSQEQSLWKGNF